MAVPERSRDIFVMCIFCTLKKFAYFAQCQGCGSDSLAFPVCPTPKLTPEGFMLVAVVFQGVMPCPFSRVSHLRHICSTSLQLQILETGQHARLDGDSKSVGVCNRVGFPLQTLQSCTPHTLADGWLLVAPTKVRFFMSFPSFSGAGFASASVGLICGAVPVFLKCAF